MCFGCGGDDDGDRDQPRQMAVVDQQPGRTQMSHTGVDRTRENGEDTVLSDAQRRGILAFRSFVDAAAETPAGPRMEYVYQQFRSAIRAGALALEEQPHSSQLSFPVVIAFFQRQVDRCVEAQRLLENAYQLCFQEAESYRQMENGGAVADAIMSYAQILPAIKGVMEGAASQQAKSRDDVQTDMDRMDRGEQPMGPQR
ncbi:hypothetical protein BDZ94DRAFT_1298274 [Collybia nuda]|uniref:Uncharacterized protein n=1 Tax=Collybia nuda TaxID=64659 RepID=A0A9P5Y3H3_9AGAR|nr:hypothetical protein BDZ94DRAFT_1298274 [Collybia nuda]